MKLATRAYGFATLASVAFFAISASLAQAAESQDPRWSQDQLSKLNAALASWEQDFAKEQVRRALEDRLSRFNAAIASLEQDVAKQNVASRTKAAAALKTLRDTRDALQAKVKGAQADMMDDQVAAIAFRAGLEAYLDAVNADVETRHVVMHPQFVRIRSN
jgi:TolA-binding protein